MATNTSIPRAKIGLNVLLQVALVLLLFGIVNYLGLNHYTRWDFSHDHKYTLSSQTKRVLANLKKPVHFIVFFSGASPVAHDVNNLLQEYSYASKKMVEVEIVDPFLKMSRAREIATTYKLRENDNVVIIDYDGRNKFVATSKMAEFEPALNLVDKPRMKVFKGEAALTSALIEIIEDGANQAYCISGHGETDLNAELSVSGLKDYIGRQNILLQTLKLSDVENIPPDAKILFVVAPRYDYSEIDIKQLRAFWEKHGRLFVFLEPNVTTPRLAAFLRDAGIVVNDDRVLCTRTVQLASGIVRGIFKEITGDFLSGSPITKRLTNVTAIFKGGDTQSLTLESERVKTGGIELKGLIQASKGYWGEVRYAEAATHGVYFDPKEDHMDPVVAASVEKGGAENPLIKVDSSRMIVVGSSGFLSNTNMTEADMDFVLNSINWLLDRDENLGIAPKTVHNFALSLPEKQIRFIFLLVILAIPACAGGIGIIVWLQRRR